MAKKNGKKCSIEREVMVAKTLIQYNWNHIHASLLTLAKTLESYLKPPKLNEADILSIFENIYFSLNAKTTKKASITSKMNS